MGKEYYLEEIKEAFYAHFYQAGELFFPYGDEIDEESKRNPIDFEWDEFEKKLNKKMIPLKEAVKKNGFENIKDFCRLVSMVDITSAEKVEAFDKWRYTDGTKNGLLNILNENIPLDDIKERKTRK